MWADAAGAIAGSIVGPIAFAPTAPLALVELGRPVAMVGSAPGPLVGAVLALGRWMAPTRRHAQDSGRTGTTG